MIKVFLISSDKQSVYTPIIVDTLTWETHRKGRAGTVHLKYIDSETINCNLGDYVELQEYNNNERKSKRILRYRIYQRKKMNLFMEITAYDQIYHWIQSKESILVERMQWNLLKDMNKAHFYRYVENKEKRMLQKMHYDYIQQSSLRKEISNEGVFPSDLILLFCRKYQLDIDSVDYSDILVKSRGSIRKASYGYKGRVTNKESPLDIIQSYIDLNTINLNKIFLVFDGANGICYKNIQEMRTYLLFTLNEIGEYGIVEELPQEYFNLVDFVITEYDDSNKEHVIVGQQGITPYYNIDRIKQLGIFYNLDTIDAEKIKDYKKIEGQLVRKTPQDILKEKKAYYDAMNETLPLKMDLNRVIGSWNVRGGSIIGIEIPTFDHKKIKIEVAVERVVHNYRSENDHTMDIEITSVI